MNKKRHLEIADYTWVEARWETSAGLPSQWLWVRTDNIESKVRTPSKNFNVMASIQRYAKNNRKDNPPHIAPFYIDFDAPDGDIKKAQTDVIKCLNFFSYFDIPGPLIRIWFSGSKGFHLTVSEYALGISPHPELTYIYRRFALYLKELLDLPTLDPAVYSIPRMWRLYDSQHPKSGKYKVELAANEVTNFDVDALQVYASTHKGELWSKDELETAPIPEIANTFAEFVTEHDQAAKLERVPTDTVIRADIDEPPICIQDILENTIWVEGKRNVGTMALASYYKAIGTPLNEAIDIIVKWGQRIPAQLTSTHGKHREASTRTTVKAIYKDDRYIFKCAFTQALGTKGRHVKCDVDKCIAIQAPPPDLIKIKNFVDIDDPQYQDKYIETEIRVTGETTGAYHAPKIYIVDYCELRDGKNSKCNGCPQDQYSLNAGDVEFIGSCMATDAQVLGMLRARTCHRGKKPTIIVKEKATVVELFASQHTERIEEMQGKAGDDVTTIIDGKQQSLVERRIYSIGKKRPAPGSYNVKGFVRTNPKSQEITFLATEVTPIEDDVALFTINDETRANLDIIRQLDTDALIEDIATNVTYLYEARELHLAVLLTYCSPLWFDFNNQRIRGWLNTLVFGDTGTGKTTIYRELSRFVGIGDLISAMSATAAGVLIGLKEHRSKGWEVHIGALPRNHTRIIAIDEIDKMTGMDINVLLKAIDEGKITVDKIVSGGYPCMTRFFAMANPSKQQLLSGYMYGVEALRELFPAALLRRIDIALLLQSNPDNVKFYHRIHENGDPIITSEMLRTLIHWVWTRKPNNIHISDEVTKLVMELSATLIDNFGGAKDIGLLYETDTRFTLARVAVAFACLDVSTDDFENVIVTQNHIEAAYGYFFKIYANDVAKLHRYSGMQRKLNELDGETYQRFYRELMEMYEDYHHGDELKAVLMLFAYNKFLRRNTILGQTNYSDNKLRDVLRLLQQYTMLDNTRYGFKKKPKFVQVIHLLMEDGFLKQ